MKGFILFIKVNLKINWLQIYKLNGKTIIKFVLLTKMKFQYGLFKMKINQKVHCILKHSLLKAIKYSK